MKNKETQKRPSLNRSQDGGERKKKIGACRQGGRTVTRMSGNYGEGAYNRIETTNPEEEG